MASTAMRTRRKSQRTYSRRVSALGAVYKASSKPRTLMKKPSKESIASAEAGIDASDQDYDAHDVIQAHSLDPKTKLVTLQTLRPSDKSRRLVPEDIVQQEAPDKLYAYWSSFGKSREDTLGVDAYTVFEIIDHDSHARKLKVQWVGYPATGTNATWETISKLRDICPEALAEYLDANDLNGRLVKASHNVASTVETTTPAKHKLPKQPPAKRTPATQTPATQTHVKQTSAEQTPPKASVKTGSSIKEASTDTKSTKKTTGTAKTAGLQWLLGSGGMLESIQEDEDYEASIEIPRISGKDLRFIMGAVGAFGAKSFNIRPL